MSQRASSTLIGAFVVTAIILAVIAYMLVGNTGLFENREKAIMYFTGSVDGLNKGAPVNVRGVKVGTVTDINIEFHPVDGDFFIPVIVQFEPYAVDSVRTMQVPDPGSDRLKYMIEQLGLRAQLKLQSVLTSQMAIQLDYHPETEFHYHGNGKLPEIPTIPMPLEKFTEQLQDLPLEQIISNLTSALSALNKIVSSPDTMNAIRSLNQTMKTVDELARNMNDRLLPLADNANRAMESIDQLAQNVNHNVQPLADNAASTLLEAQQTLAEIKALLNDDSIQMYNLNIALDEIANAARSMRNFAETIERQPETLLKGRNPRE